ncbi:MAG: phosphatase PAP2 family protein [Clostridia bacterium]|nr:phosphatase PAP2 family protein [Clostridia bacterium]
MLSYELNILKYIEGIRTDFLTHFFEAVTMLGEETILIVLVAAIYFMYDKRLAQRMFFITAVSLAFNGIVKNLVKRPRPFAGGKIDAIRKETATGYSFPSGHTQTFATGSFAFAVYFKKLWLYAFSIGFTFLIGFSRMYLGVHYPSDVLAGMLFGFIFAFLLNLLYDKAKNVHVLHGVASLALLPFAVFFLINPDPLYADFYKIYGLLAGLFAACLFEERFVNFGYDVPLHKKLLRVIFGVIFAFLFKEGLKALLVFNSLRLSLVADALRYMVVVFVIMALCPLLFKKLRM